MDNVYDVYDVLDYDDIEYVRSLSDKNGATR